MWGLSREVSGRQEVEIEMEDKAGLRDVIVALRRQMPELDGTVIVKNEDRLEDYCAFNINGQFFQDESSVKLKNDDHIRLLTLATGG